MKIDNNNNQRTQLEEQLKSLRIGDFIELSSWYGEGGYGYNGYLISLKDNIIYKYYYIYDHNYNNPKEKFDIKNVAFLSDGNKEFIINFIRNNIEFNDNNYKDELVFDGGTTIQVSIDNFRKEINNAKIFYEFVEHIKKMTLPEKERKNFSETIDVNLKILNKKVDEANNLIMQRNYEAAKKILNEYLETTLNIYKEDQITRYFTFKDIIEFYCSKEKLNLQKKVVWVDLRTDDAYKLLAYIASEEKDFLKAIDYLEKGLYFNPMNLGIRFEYAEAYKMQNNLDKMYESSKNIYEYIYEPSMLARYYRLLGYYFIEKQNYDVAYSLYAISIYYENSEMAHHEINYIKQQTGNPNFKKTTAEILDFLKQQNIPTTISQSNLTQLKNLSIEKQVIENQPSLIQHLNEIIDIFTKSINESTEINGLLLSNNENNSNNVSAETANIASMMNFRLHAEQLDIPVINNYKVEIAQDPPIVFSATDGMFVEQLVSDGPMMQNETFEQRIDLVVKNTTNFMKSYSPLNNEKSLFYYKDCSNGIFNYKIYVQDFIIEVDNITKVIRQFNAYFIEPKFNDFYQLTISSPAIEMPTKLLKLGVVDITTDQITQTIDNLTNFVLHNLKYKTNQTVEKDELNKPKVEEQNNNSEYINEYETSVINNEYDYSTILPTVEAISYLVQYFDNVFKQFTALVEEDEKKNEQFKQEFKNYNYKKTYGERFEVYIREKNYNTITCKDFSSFQSAVNDGNLKNVSSLEIKIDMDFKRGNGNDLKEHENSFTITFKPYDIKFIRKSNHNELNMNKTEKEIIEILNKFQASNTIFCSK